MREIKSPAEIALITRATKVGGEALIEAMRSTVPGLAEFEIDALAQFIFVRHGAQGEAYRDIVASGPAAMNPHHRAGDRVMNAGELVLMDYCPDLGYYRCDVTRQWPVNGKFTRDQRDLYGFYLGVYEAVLTAIAPGRTAQQILQAALPAMDKVLAATNFSKPIYAEAAKQFVERYRSQAARGGNLGHAVGMATHDFGGGSGLMRPGMVFTIEPALTVPSEQIYIRLEDMIVITQTGATVLSDFVPRSIAGVEKTIAEPGLLQQYGRIRQSQRDATLAGERPR
jgi:Xaa-Pro aminopeptidase